MKKTFNNNKWRVCHYICLWVMLMFTSCEKSMMGYEGEDYIYFCMTEKDYNYLYTTNLSFNLMNYVGDEVDLSLNVMVTGNPKNYDRPYLVEFVRDSTTAVEGTDFILPEGGVIKAGQVSDSLHIKMIKTEKLKETSVRLFLKVSDNEHFSTNLTQFGHEGYSQNVFDPRVLDITYSSMMSKPYWWTYYNSSNPRENGNLGYFTVEKITLINELYNLTYADWLAPDEGGTGEISNTRVDVIYRKFALYLIEQYKNRTPVLEKDGRLMWVTGCPWDSYVGEPWDGNYINIDD